MRIGGRKTDSVFRRYNIVDERDPEEAAQALDRKQEVSQLRHNTHQKKNRRKALGCSDLLVPGGNRTPQGTKYRRILSPFEDIRNNHKNLSSYELGKPPMCVSVRFG
jgi:hypothetical protein